MFLGLNIDCYRLVLGMHLLICFVCCSLIMGCKEKVPRDHSGNDGVVSGDTALIYDDSSGRVFKTGDTVPFTGKAVWYYPDGKPRQETLFEDGREHGEERLWHENGERAGQSFYVQGFLEGVSMQWYDRDSLKESQVNFSKGKKDGVETIWYPNGQERSVVNYHSGKRHGEAAGWYEDGNKEWMAHWRDDRLNGENREWYRNGQIKFSKVYLDGKAHGAETHWYDDGEKSWETTWEIGRENGIRTEWYSSDKKMMETPYVKGVMHGTATGWYDNGEKASELNYVNGELIAERHWTENGKLVPPDPIPPGRIKQWKTGELERLYPGQPEHTIYAAFGEPDEVSNGMWIIQGLFIGGKKSNASFTFKSGKVQTAKTGK